MNNEIKSLTNKELVAVYRICKMAKSAVMTSTDRAGNDSALAMAEAELRARKVSLRQAGNYKVAF